MSRRLMFDGEFIDLPDSAPKAPSTFALVTALTLAGRLDLRPSPAPSGTDREVALQRHRQEMEFARRARREGDMLGHAQCLEWAAIHRADIMEMGEEK